MTFDERWLQPYGVVPVDAETTGILIREVMRLRATKVAAPEGVLIPMDMAEHLYGLSLEAGGGKCAMCEKFSKLVTPRPRS